MRLLSVLVRALQGSAEAGCSGDAGGNECLPLGAAGCATPEKLINSSQPLLPSGFPGYGTTNTQGFPLEVPTPAHRGGDGDYRVVTPTHPVALLLLLQGSGRSLR